MKIYDISNFFTCAISAFMTGRQVHSKWLSIFQTSGRTSFTPHDKRRILWSWLTHKYISGERFFRGEHTLLHTTYVLVQWVVPCTTRRIHLKSRSHFCGFIFMPTVMIIMLSSHVASSEVVGLMYSSNANNNGPYGRHLNCAASSNAAI